MADNYTDELMQHKQIGAVIKTTTRTGVTVYGVIDYFSEEKFNELLKMQGLSLENLLAEKKIIDISGNAAAAKKHNKIAILCRKLASKITQPKK